MKIVLALNSFKDSCNSIEANETLKKGLIKHLNKEDITVFPLFDGGDGSLAGLLYHFRFNKIKVNAVDAMGNPIKSFYLIDQKEKTAYIELAVASGISIIGKRNNNIRKANTIGTGVLIKHACKMGVSKIILLIGGSATNDAGIGALHELGVRFLDKQNNLLLPYPDQMHKINKIIKSDFVNNSIPIEIWSDVTNPFTGPKGAVSVFSPQKGATKKDQLFLEKGMLNFQKVIKHNFNIDLNKVNGAGAAGGIGAGFYSILGASIKKSTHSIFSMLKFKEQIRSADIVITGEGSLDIQSMYGKLVHGVCKESFRQKKTVIGICGSYSLNKKELKKLGMHAAFSIVPGPSSLEDALKSWRTNMISMGENIGAILKIRKG